MQELTQDNLKTVVSEHDTVVVQYSATWCGNCRIMKPKMKNWLQNTQTLALLQPMPKKFPESRSLAKVDNLPTFAMFKGGAFVNQVQTNKFDVLKTLVDEIASH